MERNTTYWEEYLETCRVVDLLKTQLNAAQNLNEKFVNSLRQNVVTEIADWIEMQRNDVPATGTEFANAIRFHFVK